jgi:hypothetical protein
MLARALMDAGEERYEDEIDEAMEAAMELEPDRDAWPRF